MKLRLFAVLIFALTASAADATGDWYGTLEVPGQNLRIALHFTKSADGAVKASLDSIDQGAMNIASQSATLDGLKVSAEWPQIRGKFEGQANAEGTEMTGTWSQGGGSLPLKMTRQKFEITEGKPMPLTAGERDFLISHLEKSRQEFLKSIEGLSREQWTFKPGPDRWSIAECAEHLVVTEDVLFKMVTGQILKAPVKADAQRRTQADDEKVLARLTDRSQKGKAPEMLVPTGKYPTPESVKEGFNTHRDRSIQFVRGTQEDFRGRMMGSMDAYQYLVMMSGHTLRHTAQLNEVKTDAKYPK